MCNNIKDGVRAVIKKDDMCEELKVLLQIYDMSSKNDNISFYKLVKMLDGRVNKNKLSQIIDRLFDRGILTVTYLVEGNTCDRVYYITGEAENFVKRIYEKAVKQ